MLTASRVPVVALLAFSLVAVADEPKAEPKRVVLERHDQSSDPRMAIAPQMATAPQMEIVIGTATLPPGTAIGFHTHPGDEAGYVLKGSIIWKTRGQPDKTLNPGDSFFNPRGAVHSIAAAPGGAGAMVVSTWIVEKGKPLGTPVP